LDPCGLPFCGTDSTYEKENVSSVIRLDCCEKLRKAKPSYHELTIEIFLCFASQILYKLRRQTTE